jgi:hypothetical protein
MYDSWVVNNMGRTIIWVGIRKYYGFELYKTYTLLGNNMILIRQ